MRTPSSPDDELGEFTSVSRANLANRLGADVEMLDVAINKAIAETRTPTLDAPMMWLTSAANYARIWMAIAAGLAVLGGRKGRRTAIRGLMAVGIASLSANLAAKHLIPRKRPEKLPMVEGRETRMPTSSSFPSGHAASGFAFATAVTADFPEFAPFLYGLAALVAYSRVHAGVHYVSDVLAGGLLGIAVGAEVQEDATSLINARHPQSCP